jgi:hypothetical protein
MMPIQREIFAPGWPLGPMTRAPTAIRMMPVTSHTHLPLIACLSADGGRLGYPALFVRRARQPTRLPGRRARAVAREAGVGAAAAVSR